MLELRNMVYLFLWNWCVCLSCSNLAVAFSLPVTSLTFSSLVFAHQFCPGLTNDSIFLWHTSQTFLTLMTLSLCPFDHHVQLMLSCFLYTHFYKILSQPHSRRRTCALLIWYPHRPESSGAFLRYPVPFTILITEMTSFFPRGSWRTRKSLRLGVTSYFSFFFFQFQTENVAIFNLRYISFLKKISAQPVFPFRSLQFHFEKNLSNSFENSFC